MPLVCRNPQLPIGNAACAPPPEEVLGPLAEKLRVSWAALRPDLARQFSERQQALHDQKAVDDAFGHLVERIAKSYARLPYKTSLKLIGSTARVLWRGAGGSDTVAPDPILLEHRVVDLVDFFVQAMIDNAKDATTRNSD